MYKRAQSDSEYGRPLVRISYNIIVSSCMMNVIHHGATRTIPVTRPFCMYKLSSEGSAESRGKLWYGM